MRFRRSVFGGLALLGLVAATTFPGVAEDAAPPVVGKIAAFLVQTGEDGRETFRPASDVDPGSVLEYRITHTNRSGGALGGFIVNGPVPSGTVYIADTARAPEGATFEVKVGGEPWQALPAMKTVRDDEGKDVRVPAGPADYTALRWRLGRALSDGGRVEHLYRVRVAD